jgi:hypothetical protein
MAAMRLKPEEKRGLRDAMVKAFSPNSLDLLVSDHLGEPLAMITAPAELPYMVHQVIGWCEDRGWLEKLVRGVIRERPENPYVAAFMRQLGLHPVDQPAAVLEAIVGPNRQFHDANQFFHRGYVTATRVCQVRCDGEARGTASLVGPDAVLTNWHVMESTDRGARGAAGYEFVFGFARSNDGTVIDDGESFRAADDWHVASAPIGDLDAPREDELDFALVRLAESAGRRSMGNAAQGAPRRWIEMPRERHDFSRPGLAILEHPVIPGEPRHPLKLALDATARATEAAAGARVRYSVPTLSGASGSPVFDLETWQFIALHHAGAVHGYNQGIPIWRIANHPGVRSYVDGIA